MEPEKAHQVNPIETKARIDPLLTSNLSQECLEILDRIPGEGLKGAYFPANVLGSIMYNPNTLKPFLEYWVTSKTEMGLSVREQEIVILRMATLYNSDYVWKHHVPVAREFGLSLKDFKAIRTGDFDIFDSGREYAILHLTDDLINERTIRAAQWETFRSHLSDQEIVDLISLVSQYVFFALMNNALQVQIETALDQELSLDDV